MPFDSSTTVGSAFALPNPGPVLLKLIKAHPAFETATEFLDYYIDIVQNNPYRANELARTMSYLCEFEDIPIDSSDGFEGFFYRELADRHRVGFEWNKDIETFGPTNTYLITSLQSGLSLKHKLTECSDQYGEIQTALNVVDHNSPFSEVQVIGACIQLLINGSEIVPGGEPFIQSAEEVATKLKTQKSLGTVKNSDARRVLKVGQSFMQYETWAHTLYD